MQFLKTFSLKTAILLITININFAYSTEIPQTELNKRLVVDFYNKALNEKDADAAIAMMGPTYKQHNAGIQDGKEGFRHFIANFRKKFPHSHSTILRVIAEGNMVVLHVHMVNEPGTKGTAVIDIFRVDGGKLVEHWDVLEPIPAKIPHKNTMF